MKNTEIKINVEAREAGYKAAEAAAHAKFDAAQKAYDEASRRFATATAEERDEAEKAMNAAHDYCYGEAQAEYDAACKAAFEKFFSMNPTEEEIAAAEAENNTEETAEISEETAEINAADVKINVADNGKVIEQIKVDVDTAISIINRLNYRNDTFVYCNTTREDNADIKYRHFDAYKANGDKDSFAIIEIVVDGKLDTVRFFNLFRDITVDLQIDYDNAPDDDPPEGIAAANVKTANSIKDIKGKQYTIHFNRKIDDIEDNGVKFNHVDCDIDTKTGKLSIGSFFKYKNLETAYRRFCNIMTRIAAEVPDLKGWDDWMPAKKLLINECGWENENGEQIFYLDGNYSLCVDINEDTYYIFGNFPKAVDIISDLVSYDYEVTDAYTEYDDTCRKFSVNGEIIAFCGDRWVEISSPNICAKIQRTVYSDELSYDLEEWLHHDDNNTYFELSKYNISAEEFWAAMYRRGFMQRCNPFRITIEHADAPATTHEVMDLDFFYTRKGNKYTVALDKENKIVLGSLNHKHLQSFVNKIKLAFANADGVTISSTGAVEVITNDEADIQATCAEITRHAPEGWTITFDKQGNFFPVKFKGKQVATLDSLATQKFLPPEKFFEQFKPLVDKNFTPRDQFLADRYNELAMLEEMREEIFDDAEQMKTLEEMIQQVKRDIAAEELAC